MAPPGQGDPKPPTYPKTFRVTEFLLMAMKWRRQIDTGEVQNKAEIARREGITRARVTQAMGMLRLAPKVQEQIMFIPPAVRRPQVTEHSLRPIQTIANYRDQLREFHKLLVTG